MQLFIKKLFGTSNTTLKTSNQEMNDIVKKVKSLYESDLLIKGIGEIIND